MQDSLASSLRDFDREARIGPVDICSHLMRITFAMVGRSLFGAQLKDDDISLISRTISVVQEFMVRQTIQPYLNPWFAVSGELRRHEEMRARAVRHFCSSIHPAAAAPGDARQRPAADPDGCPL